MEKRCKVPNFQSSGLAYHQFRESNLLASSTLRQFPWCFSLSSWSCSCREIGRGSPIAPKGHLSLAIAIAVAIGRVPRKWRHGWHWYDLTIFTHSTKGSAFYSVVLHRLCFYLPCTDEPLYRRLQALPNRTACSVPPYPWTASSWWYHNYATDRSWDAGRECEC